MKFPSFRRALRAGIVFGASAAACIAVGQAYTVTSLDTVRMSSGGPGGSAVQPVFFSAVNTAVQNDLAVSPCTTAAPVIASGFGTNAAVSKFSAGCAFSLSSGTTNASNGVITLPQATDGWVCNGQDVTTSSNAIAQTKMTNETVNSVTIDGFQSNGAVGNWVANDVIAEDCRPF